MSKSNRRKTEQVSAKIESVHFPRGLSLSLAVIYTKPIQVDTQGQPGNQSEKPEINICNSGMVNKGMVHKISLMCHFIKYRKIIFLEPTEIQLLLNKGHGCEAERREELIPDHAHMCNGSRNWQKELRTSLEYYSCLHAL